jgi:hypothetical protein
MFLDEYYLKYKVYLPLFKEIAKQQVEEENKESIVDFDDDLISMQISLNLFNLEKRSNSEKATELDYLSCDYEGMNLFKKMNIIIVD